MRTIADAFDEFFNKTNTGIKDLIDSKLDSDATIAYATRAGSAATATNATNAANAAHADTADTATTAGKATNDGNGNNIVNTYAKKSDIPSSADAYSKSESDARYLISNGKATVDSLEYRQCAERISFSDVINFPSSNTIFMRGNEIRVTDGVTWGQYHFKPDGIYLGNTKITN